MESSYLMGTEFVLGDVSVLVVMAGQQFGCS